MPLTSSTSTVEEFIGEIKPAWTKRQEAKWIRTLLKSARKQNRQLNGGPLRPTTYP